MKLPHNLFRKWHHRCSRHIINIPNIGARSVLVSIQLPPPKNPKTAFSVKEEEKNPPKTQLFVHYSGFSKLSQIRVSSRSGRYLLTSGCQIIIHTMGKYYCCMPECHNFKGKTGKYGKSVTLHKLPSNISTRRAWIRTISRKNWKPTAYTRVCSDQRTADSVWLSLYMRDTE
jgi:hypothetical protein